MNRESFVKKYCTLSDGTVYIRSFRDVYLSLCLLMAASSGQTEWINKIGKGVSTEFITIVNSWTMNQWSRCLGLGEWLPTVLYVSITFINMLDQQWLGTCIRTTAEDRDRTISVWTRFWAYLQAAVTWTKFNMNSTFF